MKHRVHSNPHHTPIWSEQKTFAFLRYACQHYENKKRFNFYGSTWTVTPNVEVIDYLYKFGRDYQQLNMSYWEFYNYLTIEYYRFPNRFPHRRRFSYGIGWGPFDYQIHYRKKIKYQKKPHHKKKVKTDEQINKDEWRKNRKKKGKKRGYNCRPYSLKYWKKNSNSKHRQWERANIAKGNWDTLLDYNKIKFIQDPWLWN